MNKYIKYLLTFLCTFVCIFNLIPLSAFASSERVLSVPMNRPVVDSSHGYVEFLIKQKNVDFYMSYVYSFNFSCFYNRDETEAVLPTEDIVIQTFDVSSSGASLTFSIVDTRYTCYLGVGYMNNQGRTGYFYTSFYDDAHHYGNYTYDFEFSSDWEIVGYRLYSDFFDVNDNLSSNVPFSIVYSDDIPEYQSLLDVITLLGNLVSNDAELLSQFQTLLDDINTLIMYSEDIYSAIDIVNTYLQGISRYLETHLPEISDYLSVIQDYIKIHLPNIEEVLWYIDNDILVVQEKLDKIIDLLQPDTDVNVSKVDPSNFNEYNKAEQSLLDNSNVDVSSALKVEVDQNALLYIWPLAEEVLNTHPQVIGLVFTILSISIVALVLGRKGG